jgi:hypothetical protein
MSKIRYRVDIPTYVVVYLDNNLSVVSHRLDAVSQHKPYITDYHDPNNEAMSREVVGDNLDIYNNAFTYVLGLRVFNHQQLSNLDAYYQEDGEVF